MSVTSETAPLVSERDTRPSVQTNEFRLPCIIRNRYSYYHHVRWAVPVDAHTSRNFQARRAS